MVEDAVEEETSAPAVAEEEGTDEAENSEDDHEDGHDDCGCYDDCGCGCGGNDVTINIVFTVNIGPDGETTLSAEAEPAEAEPTE